MFTSVLSHMQRSGHLLPLTSISFLLVLTSLLLPTNLVAQSDKDLRPLELNKPVERELAGGQSYSYRIDLAAGQYLHVVVDQRGIDVVVALFGPDGKQIVEVDSPNGTQGPEPVSAVAEMSGSYRLEVRSLDKAAPAGRYEVKIEELRAGTAQDKNRISAQRAVAEAAPLRDQGTVESRRSAIRKYEEALSLYRANGDLDGEGDVLNKLGLVYDSLGEKQKALDYYEQALSLYRKLKDDFNEAVTLNNLGVIYDNSGDKQKALDYYTQVLAIFRTLKGHDYETAIALNNIGRTYNDLGERQKALDAYKEALSGFRAARDPFGEGIALTNIGEVYYLLGEMETALHYFSEAIPVRHASRDRRGEATTLTDMGAVYEALDNKPEALQHYTQAGTIYHDLGDRLGQAQVFNDLGLLFSHSGEAQKALESYAQALPLFRAVGSRIGEATTLNNIGKVYDDMGDRQKAITYYAQALPLLRAVRTLNSEAVTLHNLMLSYRSLNNQRLAIFYGKLSVNAYQRLRTNIQGLDKNIQKTYLRSVERTYRNLAELLLTQGRLAEAQQVLNAFKDQQYFDFDQTRPLQPLTRTPHEDEFALRYEKAGDKLEEIGGEVAELKRKIVASQPSEEETAQLRRLETQLAASAGEFSDLLKQAEAEFSKPADEKDKVGEVSDTAQMQSTLRQLRKDTGQTAVAVYTLVGEAKFHALIVTADGITSASSSITGNELNEKARELWGLLQSDAYDPTVLSNELYNAVFNPIKDKLPTDTKTILWSLDGSLRYLPMAALYDGRRYLIERYNHVYFTRADPERLTYAPSRHWTGVGMGSSKNHTVELFGTPINLSVLPGVDEELRAIFRTEGRSGGVLDGEVLRDEKFTKASMLAALARRRPVVHIASHFSFQPGDETRSFLLLGDGSVMTLAEMKSLRDLFAGVELLTLSACNTAAQQPDADGREIDAFAELAQRLGARSVMATLWPVADDSSPWLMREFYRTRQLAGGMVKAEALRKAQLALLNGSAQIKHSSRARKEPPNSPTVVITANEDRSRDNTRADIVHVAKKDAPPYKQDRRKPFAHPYYWAPVILIGNWR